MTKRVEAWAVVGDWDKGVFWWYDKDERNQFEIFRTRHMAITARNEWRRNGNWSARAVKTTISFELGGDGDEG